MSGRKPFSASTRVMLAMTGVLAASLAVLVLVAYISTVSALRTGLDHSLRAEADAYDAAVAGAPAGMALADATRSYLLRRTSSGTGLDPVLVVTLPGDRVISNSELPLERAGATTSTASGAPAYSSVRLGGVTYRVLAVPVFSRGERVGVFEAALAEKNVVATASRVALTLGAAALLALALGVPLSYWATRRALSPLRRMASDASAVSHRDPGRRIEYDGREGDELTTLARSVNDMVGRLERAYDDQRRFVADASHELRTPVAIIRGNVELLRGTQPPQAELDDGLALIESEAVRMSRLLDQLLALARLEATGTTRFQPLDVAVIAEELRARGRSLGEREFATTGACSLWVEGDPDLLDQAFLNLVRNAVAHTAPGGHVVIECSHEDDRALVSVIDDGPGIPEAELGRVFDRFYRGGGARSGGGEGAGLGLAIAKRLIELHGGTLSASNVEPHGARFTVSLPLAEKPDDAA